jgi:hypothetical protein
MRVTLAILSLLLFGQVSCSDDTVEPSPATGDKIPESFNDDPSITTLNGTWKVYSFENLDTHMVEYKTQQNSNGQDIVVEFNDTKDPHGFSGINTTNVFGGEFVYAGSRRFKLKGVISTLAGQPEWGDNFSELIRYAHYDEVTFIINDEILRIYYNFRLKSVTLVKQ